MKQRMALALAVIGIVVGTLAGGLSAAVLLNDWGWPGSVLALRLFAQKTMHALFLGLAAAALLCALGLGVGWLRSRRTGAEGTTGVTGWVLAGVLGFAICRYTVGAILIKRLPGTSQFWVDAVMAIAIGSGLWLTRWAWTAPSRPQNAKLLLWPALVATVLVGLLQVGYTRWELPDPESRPNVLLVVIDCLRRDHLGVYGYDRPTSPAIDRLAAHGRVFERAYSTASWTKVAVASIVTGRFPHRHRVLRRSDTLDRNALTLAERLASAGYRTLFLGGNAWISDAFHFEQGYDVFWMEDGVTGADLTRELLGELAPGSDQPFFAYVHFMDVHLPYRTNRYNDVFVPAGTGHPIISWGVLHSSWVRRRTAAGLMTPQDRARVRGLYDGQIRFVDDQLQTILTGLARQGLLQNTLVIITADHGEEFWEHGNFEHGHSVYDEVLRVPLIMVGPGIPAGRAKAPVSLVDIAPTILAVAGISDETEGFDGSPLNGPTLPKDREVLAVSTLYGREKYAVLNRAHKLILNTAATRDGVRLVGNEAWGAQEVYDLIHDPNESHLAPNNLPASPDWVDTLHQVHAAAQEGSEEQVRPSASLHEQLRALGYVD
jgi:arylsulfatase A-like enzyme